MTAEELIYFRSLGVGDYLRENLADISRVHIDKTKPVRERIGEFTEAVGNPYVVRVGDVGVRVCFNSCGKNISEAIADAVVNIK